MKYHLLQPCFNVLMSHGAWFKTPLFCSICHFSISYQMVSTVVKFPVIHQSSVFVSSALVAGRQDQSAQFVCLPTFSLIYTNIYFLHWLYKGLFLGLNSPSAPQGSLVYSDILFPLQSSRLGVAALVSLQVLLGGADFSGEKWLPFQNLLDSWPPLPVLFLSTASPQSPQN